MNKPENNEALNLQNDLNEKEKEEAKKNGFIIAGKSGVGKSTLINVLLKKLISMKK